MAFSATELAAALVSEMAETVNSVLSSVTPMEKIWVEVEPSVEVAVTSMEWLVAVSKSMVAPGATVTTPLAGQSESPAGIIRQAVADRIAAVRVAGKAVMPTTVPPVAFSATVLAAALVSEMAETVNSVLSSVTPIEKVCVEVEPSVEVAVTSMEWLVAVSKSMLALGATVTTPPVAFSATVSEPSASLAKAVMPTTVPPVAFSVTELAAALVSLIAETVNSVLSSVTPMAKVCVEVEPSVDWWRSPRWNGWWRSRSRWWRPARPSPTPEAGSIWNRPPASSLRL